MKTEIEVGKTYTVRYPFSICDYEFPPDDPEGGPYTAKTWTPGGLMETGEMGEGYYVADGLGQMMLTVVSIHKPGRYPTRVFYTRQWRDPDGRVFGRGNLHTVIQDKFRRLIAGYRHPVWMYGEEIQP